MKTASHYRPAKAERRLPEHLKRVPWDDDNDGRPTPGEAAVWAVLAAALAAILFGFLGVAP